MREILILIGAALLEVGGMRWCDMAFAAVCALVSSLVQLFCLHTVCS